MRQFAIDAKSLKHDDKVWTIQHGFVKVTHVNPLDDDDIEFPINIITPKGLNECYTADGKYESGDHYPSMFNNNIFAPQGCYWYPPEEGSYFTVLYSVKRNESDMFVEVIGLVTEFQHALMIVGNVMRDNGFTKNIHDHSNFEGQDYYIFEDDKNRFEIRKHKVETGKDLICYNVPDEFKRKFRKIYEFKGDRP